MTETAAVHGGEKNRLGPSSKFCASLQPLRVGGQYRRGKQYTSAERAPRTNCKFNYLV